MWPISYKFEAGYSTKFGDVPELRTLLREGNVLYSIDSNCAKEGLEEKRMICELVPLTQNQADYLDELENAEEQSKVFDEFHSPMFLDVEGGYGVEEEAQPEPEPIALKHALLHPSDPSVAAEEARELALTILEERLAVFREIESEVRAGGVRVAIGRSYSTVEDVQETMAEIQREIQAIIGRPLTPLGSEDAILPIEAAEQGTADDDRQEAVGRMGEVIDLLADARLTPGAAVWDPSQETQVSGEGCQAMRSGEQRLTDEAQPREPGHCATVHEAEEMPLLIQGGAL